MALHVHHHSLLRYMYISFLLSRPLQKDNLRTPVFVNVNQEDQLWTMFLFRFKRYLRYPVGG